MNNNNTERLLEKILFTLENIERAIRNEPKQRVPDVVYHFSDKGDEYSASDNYDWAGGVNK